MATTDQPPAPAPGSTSSGLEGRVDTIEKEQKRQGGMLQQILDRLPGSNGGGGAPPAGGAPAPTSGTGVVDLAAIQQQVRDEIQQADQRRANEQKETKWRDDVNAAVEHIKRERRPREPEQGVRGLVQRMIIGRPR